MRIDRAEQESMIGIAIADKIDGFAYRARAARSRTLVYLSNGFEAMTGQAVEAYLASDQSLMSLIHPEDAPRVASAVASGLAERRNWRVNYRIWVKGGDYRAVSETGGGWRDSRSGDLVYLDGVVVEARREVGGADGQARAQVARDIGTATGEIMKTLKTLRLLALNARLEAVRAGEHGLGFSIVAREMVDLAAQSDVAARAIDRLITKLDSDRVVA